MRRGRPAWTCKYNPLGSGGFLGFVTDWEKDARALLRCRLRKCGSPQSKNTQMRGWTQQDRTFCGAAFGAHLTKGARADANVQHLTPTYLSTPTHLSTRRRRPAAVRGSTESKGTQPQSHKDTMVASPNSGPALQADARLRPSSEMLPAQPSTVEPFEFELLGGFARMDTEVQLAIHRLATHFTNQLAKSNWLIHTGLARIDRELRLLGDVQNDQREATQQRCYLLEDALRSVSQARQGDALRTESLLREQESRTVEVLVPLVEGRVSRSLLEFKEALKKAEERMGAQERLLRLTPPASAEVSQHKLAADISARLLQSFRSTQGHGGTEVDLYDDNGNLLDESAFVARLDAELHKVLRDFLPPAQAPLSEPMCDVCGGA